MATRTFRIYVACLAARAPEARALVATLRTIEGVEVTSTWHDEAVETIPTDAARKAQRDMEEVAQADAIAVLSVPTGEKFTGGGHCSEYGAAAALGKVLIVVGDASNIFYHLSQAYRFADPLQLVSALQHSLAELREPNRRGQHWG